MIIIQIYSQANYLSTHQTKSENPKTQKEYITKPHINPIQLYTHTYATIKPRKITNSYKYQLKGRPFKYVGETSRSPYQPGRDR